MIENLMDRIQGSVSGMDTDPGPPEAGISED
jgi:hypothetical protein